jgi:hypothetical protein
VGQVSARSRRPFVSSDSPISGPWRAREFGKELSGDQEYLDYCDRGQTRRGRQAGDPVSPRYPLL